MIAGPSCTPQQSMFNSPNVYHYVNPSTSEHITSLLPPDHPEMICLQSGHLTETKFGLLGMLFFDWCGYKNPDLEKSRYLSGSLLVPSRTWALLA